MAPRKLNFNQIKINTFQTHPNSLSKKKVFSLSVSLFSSLCLCIKPFLPPFPSFPSSPPFLFSPPHPFLLSPFTCPKIQPSHSHPHAQESFMYPIRVDPSGIDQYCLQLTIDSIVLSSQESKTWTIWTWVPPPPVKLYSWSPNPYQHWEYSHLRTVVSLQKVMLQV